MWICMGCAGLLPAQELRLGIPLSHAIKETGLFSRGRSNARMEKFP